MVVKLPSEIKSGTLLDKLRFGLIRMLAGKASVIINVRQEDERLFLRRDSYVCDSEGLFMVMPLDAEAAVLAKLAAAGDFEFDHGVTH